MARVVGEVVFEPGEAGTDGPSDTPKRRWWLIVLAGAVLAGLVAAVLVVGTSPSGGDDLAVAGASNRYPIATWLPPGVVPAALQDRAATRPADPTPARRQRRVDYGPYVDTVMGVVPRLLLPQVWITAEPVGAAPASGDSTSAPRDRLAQTWTGRAGNQPLATTTWVEDGWRVTVSTVHVADIARIAEGVRLVGRGRWEAERRRAGDWVASQPVTATVALGPWRLTLHGENDTASGACLDDGRARGCAGWPSDGAEPATGRPAAAIVPVGARSYAVVVARELVGAQEVPALTTQGVSATATAWTASEPGAFVARLSGPARVVQVQVAAADPSLDPATVDVVGA